jgi:hypothetical protein
MHLEYLVNAIPDESDNVPMPDPHNSGTLPGGVQPGDSPYELARPAAFGLYIVLCCSLYNCHGLDYHCTIMAKSMLAIVGKRSRTRTYMPMGRGRCHTVSVMTQQPLGYI